MFWLITPRLRYSNRAVTVAIKAVCSKLSKVFYELSIGCDLFFWSHLTKPDNVVQNFCVSHVSVYLHLLNWKPLYKFLDPPLICDHLRETRLVHTSMSIEKIETLKKFVKLRMLQEKICKFLSGQYSKKEDSNQLNYTPSYSWRVRKSLFHFCNPNGLRVTGVCLRSGRRKQNYCHFFNKTAFIWLCTNECKAKTIPWLICQSMVNIVS